MSRLGSMLDSRKRGTYYSDRMQRILGACHDCGLLWHEEKVTYRNGATELKRVEDIEPAGTVLVTPRHEKYGLRVNPRVLKKLMGMERQFAYALNVAAATVEVDGNIVYVRAPRPQTEAEEAITFSQAWSIAPRMPRGSLLLGVDDDHQQLVLDLSAPTSVHAAIIGMTGSGKSTLMRTMALSAELIGGSGVALFDPSRGLLPLSGHPSVWRGGLFSGAEECEAGLAALASSLGRRDHGLLYVFVDEVPELVMQQPRIKDHLARIAQSGRHAGMHLIIGAQHVMVRELGSLTMRNISVRLVGRVADHTAAYHAASRRDSHATLLRGKGDFVAVNGSSQRRFQAACVGEATLEAWMRRYPPRDPRMPARARVKAAAPAPPRGEGQQLTGRPRDPIPDAVMERIRGYVRENGRAPSSNWVYRVTREMLPTGGFSRDKARRAIEAAMEGVRDRQPAKAKPRAAPHTPGRAHTSVTIS